VRAAEARAAPVHRAMHPAKADRAERDCRQSDEGRRADNGRRPRETPQLCEIHGGHPPWH
jgi:hypothetical protein